MCVLTFSTTLVRNVSHSKNNWARYDKKCILVFMYSTRYSWPILMKLEFSRQNLEKYSSIKLHANSPNGSLVVPYGTDGQTWQLTVAFHNFANAPKKHKQMHLHISPDHPSAEPHGITSQKTAYNINKTLLFEIRKVKTKLEDDFKLLAAKQMVKEYNGIQYSPCIVL
jgi:hypothetical protein